MMLPVLFILCSLPLLAEPMTALSFRMIEPKLEEGPPTKLWRHRDDQFRLEYQEFLQINDGFDIWSINMKTNKAVYSVDPDGKSRIWIFSPEQIPEAFHGLELGKEREFIDSHPFQEKAGQEVDGITCNVLEYAQGDASLRFYTDAKSQPVMVELTSGGQVIFKIRYESYQLLPWDRGLFRLPGGSQIEVEGQPVPSSSAVYEPWLGETLRAYGPRNFEHFKDHLKEDLAPTVEQAKQQTTLSLSEALDKEPGFAQWPALSAASRKPVEQALLTKLEAWLKVQPDATDRAWAYRILAQNEQWEGVKWGLFDDYASNRYLCMELLEQPVSDMTILLPSRPLNPFHYNFLEAAVQRRLGDVSPGAFFDSSVRERAAQIDKTHLQQYLTLAKANKDRVIGAGVLLMLGSDQERSQALGRLEDELLAQAERPDVFHGQDFWLRGDIIQIFANHPETEELTELLTRTVESYSPKKEMLLLALAYSLDYADAPGAASSLARVSQIKTDNYDLYLASALALSKYDEEKAKGSLLHVVSLKRQPFVSMALLRLEKLTGQKTPGWGEGRLHPDMDEAYKFWEEALR